MTWRRVATLSATALLGACAASLPRAPTVDLGGDCRTSVREVAARTIPLRADGERNRLPAAVQFAALAECVIDQATGAPTAVARFVVDPQTVPMLVTIEVIGSERGTLPAAVTLLDASLAPLASHPFASFVQRGSNYLLTVHVSDPNTNFLIVAPDPLHLGSTRQVVGMQNRPLVIYTTAFVGSINNGIEQRQQLPLDAAGELRLYAEPYRPQPTHQP